MVSSQRLDSVASFRALEKLNSLRSIQGVLILNCKRANQSRNLYKNTFQHSTKSILKILLKARVFSIKTASNILMAACQLDYQMLNIKTIRLLSKVQGLFDKITTPEVVVKIVIDDFFVLPQIKGATDAYQTVWKEGHSPLIQLSSYQKAYKLQFAVYRETLLIGTASTQLNFGQVLKQQNDVLDQKNVVTGRILYQCTWEKESGTDFVTYQQFIAFKEKNKASGGNLGAITFATKRQEVRTYIKREEDEDCGCGCFGGGKRRPQPSQQRDFPQEKPQEPAASGMPRIFNKETKAGKINEKIQYNSKFTSYLYLQSELQGGNPKKNQDVFRLVYYSKGYCLSK